MITFTANEQQRIGEIETFLRFVHPDGRPIGVRALGNEEHGTIRHLSSSHRDLAKSAIMAEQTGAPVYWCLNVIKSDSKYVKLNLTERPLRHVRFTAKDSDILWRSNYLIDIDSIHPKGVNATDAEKAAAFEVADHVRTFLTEHGWPEPIVVDSGNGTQLLYRGDIHVQISPWCHSQRVTPSRSATAADT